MSNVDQSTHTLCTCTHALCCKIDTTDEGEACVSVSLFQMATAESVVHMIA